MGLGTLNLRPDSLPRPCTAWLGRRRAAGLSHRDSEVRLPPPILGLPTSLLVGGLGQNCRSGPHPAEHEASGNNNSNNNAVAISLASQSPARQTKLD